MIKRLITFILVLAMVMALAPAALAAAPGEEIADETLPQFPEEETVGEALQLPEEVIDDLQPQALEEQDVEAEQIEAVPLAAPTSLGVTLNTTDHIAYIEGSGSGNFKPNSYMTRAEIAVMIFRVLSDTVPVTVSYTDVPANTWYTDAALQLGSLGVLRPGESTFRPYEYISRGEFANCIAAFFPLRTDAEQFPDVWSGHKYWDAILSGRAYGWLEGWSDGLCHPQAAITRCEAVTIINRALGRTSDKASIQAGRPALYLDVPVNAWYYYDVMEATVPHTYTTNNGAEKWTSFREQNTGLPADFRTWGFHVYQGWSYFYDSNTKGILRSCTQNGYTFDANGHFTTGDTWIDQQLRQIVLSETTQGMTQEEMLRAFFAYCRDNYKYLKWNIYRTGDTSFMRDAARQMLSTGRGNCYCYASVFWYLAQWIGYGPRIYSGRVLGGPHSWVEIDGYIYDTQLEWRYVHDYGRSQYLWTFYHMRDTNDTYRYRK